MQSVLNEGSFMDALTNIADSTLKSAKDQKDKNKNTYMYGSISKYTNQLVMSFPTICDNTIPISTAQLISKAHEKNLASMFEMLLASMSLSGNNGVEIVKALHKNLDSSSIDDIIDAIEKAVGESTQFSKAEIREIIQEMCDYLKYNQKSLPVESLSESSLNEYLVRESNYGMVVMEARRGNNNSNIPKYTQQEYDDAYNQGKQDEKESRAEKEYQLKKNQDERQQRDQDGELTGREKQRRAERQEDRETRAKERETDYQRRTEERKADREARNQERETEYQRRKAEREEDRKARENERREDREAREKERQANDRKDEFLNNLRLNQNRVKDIDYKKANELQPTLITITYNTISPDGSSAIDKKSFVAGIKSRLVGSDPMEIVERVSAAKSNKLTFKDLVRATTGEISLVKDFIAATKQAKINAKNAAKRGETAKMWNVLSSRAKANKANRTMNSNDASCITTLVISQDTVNYITNQYKINLDSPKDAANVMKQYNLLAIVIADEANEVAKFLYDGNNSYEMVAYSSLSKDKADQKDVNKAINYLNATGR